MRHLLEAEDFERAARFGLAAGLVADLAVSAFAAGAGWPARFCAATVLIRAMSRRASRRNASAS